jgi:hypothetical protein
MKGLNRLALGVLCAAVGLVLTNCSGKSLLEVREENLTGVDSEALRAASTFSWIYARILSSACVECHNPSGMATVNYHVQLNFADRSAAYATLLVGTVNGVTSTGTCAPLRIVKPGSPRVSYLLGTLIQSYSSPNFGGIENCTPYAGHFSISHLSSEQKAALIGWVQSGALDN